MPYDEPTGWSFIENDKGVEVASSPSNVVIESVELLFKYQSSDALEVKSEKTIVRVLDNMIPGWLLQYINVWSTRLISRNGAVDKIEESSAMTWKEDARRRDMHTEKMLRLIISNEKLAAEAFPNSEIRNNILPLVEASNEQLYNTDK